MIILIRLTLLIVGVFFGTAHSFTATSYEPMHCTLPVPNLTDASTSFSIFGTTTSGSLAYNGSEKTSAFLEQYGTVAAQDIIAGLTPPSADSLAYTYLHAGGAHSIIEKDATLRFDDSDNNYSFSSTHLTLTQHLFTGLFVQVYGQFVEQSLAQRPTASGPDANDSAVKDF